MKMGAIGCSMSHLDVLKIAKKNNWDYVTIFEDDVLFLKPQFIWKRNQ
jgi:GR25 family glycosyltransferase involved in LPS biosynthesis